MLYVCSYGVFYLSISGPKIPTRSTTLTYPQLQQRAINPPDASTIVASVLRLGAGPGRPAATGISLVRAVITVSVSVAHPAPRNALPWTFALELTCNHAVLRFWRAACRLGATGRLLPITTPLGSSSFTYLSHLCIFSMVHLNQ